jgi:hypothetical protein
MMAVLTAAPRLWAADPGELFPDIPYSTQVGASPVTHEEESLKPVATPTPPPPPPTPAPAPAVDTPPANVAPAPDANPPAPPPAPANPSHGPLIWFPYAQKLLDPILPPDDKEKFDSQMTAMINNGLNGTPENMRAVSSILFSRAANGKDSPPFKRYLYLHSLGMAIRAKTSAFDREKKARAVLPLLKDRELAVAQTRTECLASLAGGTATGTLATLLAHSYATLAQLQVQTGYPKEAYASLDTARKWLEPNHPPLLTAQMAATNDWVKRAQTAATELRMLKTKLAANSKDSSANTELAMIQLGIYGDLAKSLQFALDSKKPELQKLAAAAKDLDLNALAVDSPADAQKSLPVIIAMIDIARSAVGPDRYLVAYHAMFRLDELAAALPAQDVANLKAELKKISDKITDPLDAYDSLEQLPDPKPEDPTADASDNPQDEPAPVVVRDWQGNYRGIIMERGGHGRR